jgi:hypothetical protein
MGGFLTRYIYSSCVPFDDKEDPIFLCCEEEIGTISRYRVIFKQAEYPQKPFFVVMSFCLLKERKVMKGDQLVSCPYSQEEIDEKLKNYAWHCIHWMIPYYGCQETTTYDYKIIFHGGLEPISSFSERKEKWSKSIG